MNPVMQALATARTAEMDKRLAERDREQEQRERAAANVVNARLHLPVVAPADPSDWEPFDRWAKAKGLRSLPAKPSTIGFWILDQGAKLGEDRLLRILAAISAAHAAHADPTLGPVVARAIATVTEPIPVPRSWPKSRWSDFAQLPRGLQVYVAARAAEQEKATRQAMQQAGDAKHELKTLKESHGRPTPVTESAQPAAS